MSSFVIKLIAVFTMLIDHTCDVIIQHYSVGYIIGRIAFPLFAFQLVIGYENTHDIKKYLKRLLIFALLAEVPYAILFYNYVHQIDVNIFFTLFFALVSLIIWDSKKVILNNKFITWTCKLLLIALICFVCEFLHFDHGYGGILTVLLIYLFYPYSLKEDEFMVKKRNVLKDLLFFFVMFLIACVRFSAYLSVLGIYDCILLVLFASISTLIMLAYNGKKGPSFQYFFYAFYPLHLAILDIIYYIRLF